MCACGIPNRANYYLSVIVGRDIEGGTETDSVDIYLCDEHTPNVAEGHHSAQDEPYWFAPDAARVHSVLAFDGASDWDVLEYTLTELR